MKVTLEVNGAARAVDLAPRMTLLDALRDVLGLKGTRAGCEHGVCGACTVLVDGEAVRACLILGVQAEGMRVSTIEGPGEARDVIRDAFCETHGLQCGYCTSGMILAAEALLAREPDPSDEEIRDAISGNICRCTGYGQIVEAVRLAARLLRQQPAAKGAPA